MKVVLCCVVFQSPERLSSLAELAVTSDAKTLQRRERGLRSFGEAILGYMWALTTETNG